MQRLSIFSISLLLYAIFIFAGTCFCLGLLAFSGHMLIWRDLDFPINLRTVRDLLGYAAGATVLGYSLYLIARRLF